jgi:5'-nucleotidase
MRILLTNDDGVNARGLKLLERIAARFSDEIWVVAPTEEQSGAGHSLTLTRPVRLRQLGERRFCVTGTPTDAVMMAIAHIMKDCRPDLILSGINRGANLAEDVTYSGTVSAAMEGALAGIPAIALSQGYAREEMGDTVPFAAAEAWAERVLAPLLSAPFAPRTLVNVNFPALAPEEVRGIRVVRQGLRDYGRLRIVQRTDTRGYDYFWFGLRPTLHTPGHASDLESVADGYVAVTPLHLDLTHEPSLGALAALFPASAAAERAEHVDREGEDADVEHEGGERMEDDGAPDSRLGDV